MRWLLAKVGAYQPSKKQELFVKLKMLLLTLLVPIASHAGDVYLVYKNVRFGFSVEIPTNQFVPQGESDNGDGQVFSSRDGNSEIRAYGGWLMEPEFSCAASSVFADKATRVSYESSKGRVSVSSGYAGFTVFYVKTIRTSDRCLNLVITYPFRERSQFDIIVKRVSQSFGG